MRRSGARSSGSREENHLNDDQGPLPVDPRSRATATEREGIRPVGRGSRAGLPECEIAG